MVRNEEIAIKSDSGAAWSVTRKKSSCPLVVFSVRGGMVVSQKATNDDGLTFLFTNLNDSLSRLDISLCWSFVVYRSVLFDELDE